jgi:hypothetical protein
MRLHPDLRDEMTRLARMEGWKLAQWIEKSLIDAVNAANGREVIVLMKSPPPSLVGSTTIVSCLCWHA